MRVVAQPIVHREDYAAPVEAAILDYFRETLFDPLRAILEAENLRLNGDAPALWRALHAGRVQYADGVFTGSFDAATSLELRQMGARKIPAGFALAPEKAPVALRGTLALMQERSRRAHLAVVAFLLLMMENLPDAPPELPLRDIVDKMGTDLHRQLVSTLHQARPSLPVPPNPPGWAEENAGRLTRQTTDEVSKFSLEQAEQLRDRVAQNLASGGRMDRLRDIVSAQFGAVQRKVRTIAECETSKLVSDYRQARYEALGSKSYIWDTSHDEKVRPTHHESNNHRVLDGREFQWSAPPVVDPASGRRRHPGLDYGPCRCVALPVFNFHD